MINCSFTWNRVSVLNEKNAQTFFSQAVSKKLKTEALSWDTQSHVQSSKRRKFSQIIEKEFHDSEDMRMAIIYFKLDNPSKVWKCLGKATPFRRILHTWKILPAMIYSDKFHVRWQFIHPFLQHIAQPPSNCY